MIKEKRQMGALIGPRDERDYKFASLMTNAGFSTIPKQYTCYSDEPIRDQKWTSMCGAFAGTSYRYTQEYYQSNNNKLYSPLMVYGADTYSGEGMYSRNLAKILVKTGVCHVQDWETLGYKNDCQKLYKKYKDKTQVKEDFSLYKTTSYYFCYYWSEIIAAIYATKGCIIMFPVYDNWYSCKSDGKLEYNYGSHHGYHFVFAVGYKKEDNNSYTIKIKNSWGTGWGDNGYGYINTAIMGFEEAFAIVDNVDEVKNMLYKDVPDNQWYTEAVELVTKAGLMKGDGNDTFRPNDPITRAEIAEILCRTENLK